MRVVQLLPTLSFGDAVSNDALALERVIADMGYETGIYADIIGKRLPAGAARKTQKLAGLRSDDVIIYHKSTGTDLDYRLDRFRCRKLMIYHNITPPEYFSPYNAEAAALTAYGYEGLAHLRERVEFCLADSEYNKRELIRRRFTCPIEVRPVLIPFADYDRLPDGDMLDRLGDGRTNILFVGRIAPNKRQEELIRTFYFYKKADPTARLILAGSDAGFGNYSARLKAYAKALGLEDVIFTGKISFPEILSCYRTASVFLCMSAHEGFCVPLAEAMHFNVPVIALDTSAVAGTLGGSGFLISDSDPLLVSGVIERVMNDGELRQQLINGQRERLADFSYERIRELFEKQLRKFISREL